MRRRHLSATAVVLTGMAVIALSGCATDDDPAPVSSPSVSNDYELVRPGALTVCTDPPSAPFWIEDPQAALGFSGFEVELLAAIAEPLDLEVVVLAGVDDLDSGAPLVAEDCDIAASAFTTSAANRESFDFSDPHYDSVQSLLVSADSGISSFEDLVDRTLGVQRDSAAERIAENAPEETAIIGYASEEALWEALQMGGVDAILQEHYVNVERVRADSGYVIVAEHDVDEDYAFAFAKGEKEILRAVINAALAQLHSDEVYQQIHDAYFPAE